MTRPAAKKSQARKTGGAMAPPRGGAVVRMYCTGLGDCFLLGFPAADGETSYVLVDCGVWKGTPGATAWMRRIMRHIRDEVGDRGLDLLVATHQHWDHLSGFSQAREIFQDLKVKQVWMPWTEDPEDRAALRLAEERRLAMQTAMAAVGRLGAVRPQEAATLQAVLQLGAGPTTDDLMDIVRGKVRKPSYVRPSLAPLSLDQVPGVRIYALGPPTNLKYLGKDDPSTVPGKSEVYLAPGMPLNEDSALYAAAWSPGAPTPEDQERRELAFPFDRWQRYTRETAAADPDHGEFFRTRYLESPEWRRIETDWLDAAGQLALNLDDHVNNTSLALAFELGEGGPVLLFPGDAQVGNWLSWHELQDSNGLTAESLLNRTVVYKVGHHASHNATLKDKGLKMMTATSRLVAMIPVDEAEARKPKGRNKNGWAMPYDKLLADLQSRTEGRILRADRGLEKPDDQGWDAGRQERWRRFAEAVEAHAVDAETGTRTLFLQYTFDPAED